MRPIVLRNAMFFWYASHAALSATSSKWIGYHLIHRFINASSDYPRSNRFCSVAAVHFISLVNALMDEAEMNDDQLWARQSKRHDRAQKKALASIYMLQSSESLGTQDLNDATSYGVRIALADIRLNQRIDSAHIQDEL